MYKDMSKPCQIIIAHSLLDMHLPHIIKTKGTAINKDENAANLSYFWHILADRGPYSKREAVDNFKTWIDRANVYLSYSQNVLYHAT